MADFSGFEGLALSMSLRKWLVLSMFVVFDRSRCVGVSQGSHVASDFSVQLGQ